MEQLQPIQKVSTEIYVTVLKLPHSKMFLDEEIQFAIIYHVHLINNGW